MARLGYNESEKKTLTSQTDECIIPDIDKFTKAVEVLQRARATKDRAKITVYIEHGRVTSFEFNRYY